MLIGLGLLFLLEELNLLDVGRIFDFWPVILIVVGILMLRPQGLFALKIRR